MRYMGGKGRIADALASVIEDYREEGQWWVEPFVGGGGMIGRVKGPRYGSDIDPYVIAALRLIRDEPELLPKSNKETSKEYYYYLKQSEDENDMAMKGYYGYALSYGGKWWGGFIEFENGHDYVAESYRNALVQHKKLQGVFLHCYSYEEAVLPSKSSDPAVVYCDPPYEGTTTYKYDFDHAKFWQWCRDISANGHKVFVSEYKAPPDFTEIWAQSIQSVMELGNSDRRPVERLFTYNLKVKQKTIFDLAAG